MRRFPGITTRSGKSRESEAPLWFSFSPAALRGPYVECIEPGVRRATFFTSAPLFRCRSGFRVRHVGTDAFVNRLGAFVAPLLDRPDRGRGEDVGRMRIPGIVRVLLLKRMATGRKKLQRIIVQKKGAKSPENLYQNTRISLGSWP